MFTAAPTTQTLSHVIIQYRDMLQNVIATTSQRDPLLILQAFLREYIATNPGSFFAARLIHQLNRQEVNVLALLNEYFAGALLDKQSPFYAALAAYFYYYADYYQVDCGLYSENEYPELMRQLILPLRTYQQHVSDQFKEKYLSLVNDLDPDKINFLATLNKVCAAYTPDEHRQAAYQKLITILKGDLNRVYLYLNLCELGVADEDKEDLIAAYIEKEYYLDFDQIMLIFSNDDDAIDHLINLCGHHNLSVRNFATKYLSSLYEKTTPEKKLAIALAWLEQTDDECISVMLSAWHKLLKRELPNPISKMVYAKLLEHARYQHSAAFYSNQVPVTLSYYFFDHHKTMTSFNNEQYQTFVDQQIHIEEPLDDISKACINQIVFSKLNDRQKNKLIPIYRNLIVNENNMNALNSLFNIPVDMALWKIMIAKQFEDLQGDSISTFRINNMPASDEQLRYATEFMLRKLSSTQVAEVIAACAAIRYYQHPSLKENVTLQIWQLINFTNPIIAIAAATALQYLKPDTLVEAFTDRVIQLINQDQNHDYPELFCSLISLSTINTKAKIIDFLKNLAFSGDGNVYAINSLNELKIPFDRNMISAFFKAGLHPQSIYMGISMDINGLLIPDEFVAEVVTHLLQLITLDDPINTLDACKLLISLPPLYNPKNAILAIASRLDNLTDLNLFAQSLLKALNHFEIPATTCIPLAKSLVSLLKKCLMQNYQLDSLIHIYDLIKPLLNKIMQQASCADRCSILALLDSPDFTQLSLRSYTEKLKADFIQPLVLTEEVRRKAELPYMPAEMWGQIQLKQR